MTDTANLGMPFIDGSQAQKHITHNEALRILDAAIQIGVLDVTRTAPPSIPVEGERHVVAASATGAWAGQDRAIATYEDATWRFLTPKTGWCAWSAADNVLFVYDGMVWRDQRALPTSLDNVAHVGINTTASSPNLLSVRSNAALFAAINASDGGTGDARIQISKGASANTASVVFSDAYSGRAEFGLVGSDAFKLKVSPDGSAFVEAFNIDQTSGNLTLLRGLTLTGVIAPAQITSNQNDFSPTGLSSAAVVQVSSDTSRGVSGLAGGSEGRVVSLLNTGSQTITLLDESTSSATANRFTLGGDLAIAAKQAVILRYDGTATRWFALARSGGAGSAGALAASNNLSDVANKATARTNLGVAIGSNVQAWDPDLDALAANAAAGLWASTGLGTGAARSLTAPAAGLTIANPAGTSGNPAFALANDLAAVEGLSGTGFAVRSAADTWLQRSIGGTANEIAVTNGDGVAAAPSIGLPSALTFTGKTVTGGTFNSPQLNTPTGIVKGDVGLGNVDNTSDATKNSAAATLTNKSLTAPVIGTIVNTGTLTLPTSTDTLVGRATTDTLTNKTISGASNTLSNIALTSLATQASNSFVGNVSGSTAAPVALTQSQATAALNVMTGDSGSGGTKGLAPAPASGDASAGKYLKADGTWSVPPYLSPPSGTAIQKANSGGALTNAVASDVAAIFPAMTGDVTTSAGSVATTIANSAVTFSKLASAAIASAANFLANAASVLLTPNAVWSAAARTSLTDAATVTPDFSVGINFQWIIGATGRTLANPANIKEGQTGVIYLVQDATGSRTITTWGTYYKFSGGTKPALSTAASAIDVLAYHCKSATEIECFFTGNMS